jgi:hypothetical protein
MWETYRRIISPFSCLPGLQNLSVYASWPIRFSQREIRPQWESRLEQIVLGGGEDGRAKWKRTMEDGYWKVQEMGGKISPYGGRGPEFSNMQSRLPSVSRNQPRDNIYMVGTLTCLDYM